MGEEKISSPLLPVPTLAFFLFWLVTSLVAFSIAGEKMPWLGTHLTVPLILLSGWYFGRIVEKIDFRKFMERRDPGQQSRIQTLGRVFRYTAAVVIWLVGGMLVLGELGISVAPLLATAGVAGVAIGFGAQSLIKDYFNGFFLLLEDQLRQGDVVDLGGPSGAVEEVTLRYVRLRNFDGHVIFVPNGEIKIVKNMTRDFAQAVIEVGVAYREEMDEALDVMRQVGQEMRADPVFGPKIADDAEIIGVEKWGDSAVTIRCRLKVIPPAAARRRGRSRPRPRQSARGGAWRCRR